MLIPGQLGVDIFAEFDRLLQGPYELCVLQETVRELEVIKDRDNSKESGSAKVALGLIEAKKIRKIAGHERDVDTKILEFATKNDCIVATQDKELKERLQKNDIRLIVLRQKKYLIMV